MREVEILHVTSAQVCGPYSLRVRFNDGVAKRVNLRPLLGRGVFKRLLDPRQFATIRLSRKWGVVYWPPDDIDLAPEALHDLPEEPDDAPAKPTRRRNHLVRPRAA